MINIFLYALFGTLALGYADPEINTELVEQQKSCLTIENFNSVASFVEDHGEQIKISERLLSDKGSLALEVSTGRRFVLLEKYQDHKSIIIIDKNEDDKTPPYFVSNENNEIQISAYNSRFDNDEDSKKRAEDWCDIVLILTKKQ